MSGQVRVADALLRSLGGRTVLLHIPAAAVQGDVGEQLGLALPTFQDVALGPVVFRKMRPKIAFPGASGDSNRAVEYELLVSASAVEKVVGSLESGAAGVLFGSAAGVVVDGALMEITSVTTAEGFGVVYLYRVGLKGSAAGLV